MICPICQTALSNTIIIGSRADVVSGVCCQCKLYANVVLPIITYECICKKAYYKLSSDYSYSYIQEFLSFAQFFDYIQSYVSNLYINDLRYVIMRNL